MRSIPIVVCTLALVLGGCGSDTSTSESVQTTTPPAPATQAFVPRERVYVTTLEDFPDWVPLPDEFVVIIGGKAGGVGVTVIETSGDPAAVVAYLNTKLSAGGLSTINLVEDEDNPGRFLAQGVVNHSGRVAVINVGAYDPGGAMKPGNTMSISYTIGG